MVATGMAMLVVAWAGAWLMWRRGAEAMPRPWLMVGVGMAFSGWVATLAGWYTTEIGRQPWLVQGVLTTEAAVGEVAAGMVLSSLIAYLVVYAVLLAIYVGVLFHLARKDAGLLRPAAAAAPYPTPAE
jgi:cytochrome d ubiquinol oxidase subunit I